MMFFDKINEKNLYMICVYSKFYDDVLIITMVLVKISGAQLTTLIIAKIAQLQPS